MITISQHVRAFDSHDGEYDLVCHDLSRDGVRIGSAWSPEGSTWNYQLDEAFLGYDAYVLGRAASRDEAFATMTKMADDRLAEAAARAAVESAIAAAVAELEGAPAVELLVTEWRGSVPTSWAVSPIQAEHKYMRIGLGSGTLSVQADVGRLVRDLISEARQAY